MKKHEREDWLERRKREQRGERNKELLKLFLIRLAAVALVAAALAIAMAHVRW